MLYGSEYKESDQMLKGMLYTGQNKWQNLSKILPFVGRKGEDYALSTNILL